MSDLAAGAVLAVAGGLGALARYAVDTALRRRLGAAFPWPTLAVNVTDSLLLGFLTGLAPAVPAGPVVLTVLGTGFCGGYTTFGTAVLGVVRLRGEGGSGRAAAYAAGTLLATVVAAAVGLVAGAAVTA